MLLWMNAVGERWRPPANVDKLITRGRALANFNIHKVILVNVDSVDVYTWNLFILKC